MAGRRTTRNPWHDRFARPNMVDLKRLYEPDTYIVFDALQSIIAERTESHPDIAWRGVAWRWTLVYTRPGDEEPWAYIIPSEQFPTLALPVLAEPLPPSELKRIPRFIRDKLLHAPRVGQVCWIECAPESTAQVTDLARFIDRVTEPQPA